MAYFLYASFPNSRGRPRSATINANTFQIDADIIGQPLTKAVDTDYNRTYTNLENLSALENLLYLYAKTVAVNPTLVATDGVEMELAYNVGSNTLYQKQDDGSTTNWLVVQPEDVAHTIYPEQNATLDALGEIWVLTDGAAPITIGVETGRG